MGAPSEFVIVGGGWRAEFFLRAARGMPGLVTCAGVTSRRAERREELHRQFGVGTFATVDDALKCGSDFVVLATSRESAPDLLEDICAQGVPVLLETPPGLDIPALRRSWRVSRGSRVQVAEQYRFQPHHAARLAVLDQGVIGERHQARLSVAHGYHAVSLFYDYLGLSSEDWQEISVSARRISAPVVRGPGRLGPPEQEEIVTSDRMLAVLGRGTKNGIYDFDGEQYFSEIRRQSVAVRGERGELVDDEVVYLPPGAAWRARSDRLVRVEGGQYGDLRQLGLVEIRFKDKAVFSQRAGLGPVTDEEVAVAECLVRMSEYVRGGPEFYSVYRACCDRYLETVIEASAEQQRAVVCRPDDWMGSGS